MSVKEVNTFLQKKNFRPSRKMGQNFLINPKIKKMIVDAADLQQNDVVLEIGPGTGAITSFLLMHKIKLIAFELDKRLAALLITKFKDYKNFILKNVDALKVDWTEILQEVTQQHVKLVANLPYSISSLLVLKIIQTKNVDTAIIMVQKEMAERLSAKVGTHSYNMFTVLVKLYLKTEKLFDVDSNNFSPRPKVDSTVIKLSKIQTQYYSINDFDTINSFLKIAFSNKRKTLVNNLSSKYPKENIYKALAKLNFSLTIRAEQIKPLDLLQLMRELRHA